MTVTPEQILFVLPGTRVGITPDDIYRPCLLPPQAPGHRARIQWIRESRLPKKIREAAQR